MSEEEIKDIIEEILQDPFIVFSQDVSFESTQIKATAIKGLLDLYNKQKEENKRLKIELEIKKYCKVDELARDLIYYKDLASKYQGSCISKDKIREKIKELKAMEISQDIYTTDIETMFEELLEE